jgi:branched-chain amino acid transport system substrate-binding protein
MTSHLGRIAGGIAVAAAVVVAALLLFRDDALSPAREVTNSACSQVNYEGDGEPSALIVLTTALQGAFADHGTQSAQAVNLVLDRRDWRAGEHTVGVQVCNEVPQGADDSDADRCESIAHAIASNDTVLGVISPWSSSCAPLLTVLNRSPGPVAVISASASYLGLTRTGPGVADGDPARFQPSGRRNFARVIPADDVQAAAGVVHLQRLGARRMFVLDDGLDYGRGVAGSAQMTARRAGIEVAGTAAWDPGAREYSALARRVRDSRADAVYLGGFVDNNGARLIRDLRRALGAGAWFVGPDGFSDTEYLTERAGQAAEGFVYTIATLPSDRLAPAGRRFAAEFERRFGDLPCCYAVQNAQAAEILLDAIADSDGSRRSVTRNVLAAEVADGPLGDFHLDEAGDTSANTIAVYEITGGRGRYRAAVSPPAALLARSQR